MRRRRVFVRVTPAPAAPAGATAVREAGATAVREAGATAVREAGAGSGGTDSDAVHPPRTVVTIGGVAKNADPGLASLLQQLRDELTQRT